MGGPLLERLRRAPRWIPVSAAIVLILAIALVAAHRPIVAAYVRHRAAGLGVELEFDDMDLRRDAIRLTGARATLTGVRGLRVEAARLKLKVPGFAVESVDASEVKILVEGSATDRVLELSDWSSEHADAYRMPGAAREIRLEWRDRAGGSPWLLATGGALSSDGQKATVSAAATTISGVPLGPVSAGFAVGSGDVTVDLGKGTGGEPLVRARVTTSGQAPRVELDLRPIRLDALGSSLGVSVPVRGAVASGRAEMTLGRRRGDGHAGQASLLLDGWVPPHPRELGGVITGKRTTLSTKIALAADHGKITLTDLAVKAGKLELKGSGTITREGDHALIKLDVGGPIACADVVRSAARSSDLGLLGEIAGDVASGAVGGVVTVNVSVEADSRDLGAAKIKPKVGVGCRLGL